MTRLYLSAGLLSHIESHVSGDAPLEACGLIAGHIDRDRYQGLAIFPIANVLYSSTRYRMDAYQQLRAFRQIEGLGWELVGIYHSHPRGPDRPSATDIAEAYYPECVYLICYQHNGKWSYRGFKIENMSEVYEIPLISA